MKAASTAPAQAPGELDDDADVLIESYFGRIDDKNLTEHAQACANEYREAIRRAVIDEGRIDILVEEVLGYQLLPFHARLLIAQDDATKIGEQYWAMVLAFRGSGKSTITTIARTIFEILRNPNIRILLSSNTNLQAEVFLREVKAHFESNPKFREIFGDDWIGDKWGGAEILVSKRTRVFKESTVTCIGVGGPTASRHYDLLIGDDLVDEENSRTALQRQRLLTWVMKTWLPTLEPGGRLFISGTCWHPEDLYAYLEKAIPGMSIAKVKAIQDDGTSPWPEKFPVEHFVALRQTMGVPEFESQYQMNTAAMQGKIFSYDMFAWFEDKDLPESTRDFTGVDLAISQKDTANKFAIRTVHQCPTSRRIYVGEGHAARYSFNEQTRAIREEYGKEDPIIIGIESNAYQAAQSQNLRDQDSTMRIRPVFTLKDKVTRAMKLAARCQTGEILFHRQRHTNLIGVLLKMPDVEDDEFDALEIAVDVATRGVRKPRPADQPRGGSDGGRQRA